MSVSLTSRHLKFCHVKPSHWCICSLLTVAPPPRALNPIICHREIQNVFQDAEEVSGRNRGFWEFVGRLRASRVSSPALLR